MSESDKTPQRAVMHFYFQLGKSTLETVELMNRACNERKVNRRLVYRWFERFGEGNVSLIKNQQRTGRLKDGRSEENVTLVSDVVNEDRRVTVRSLCETLNLSCNTVQRILTEDLNMKRLCARWVLILLKEIKWVCVFANLN